MGGFPDDGTPPARLCISIESSLLYIKAVEATSELQAKLQRGRDGTEEGLLKSGTDNALIRRAGQKILIHGRKVEQRINMCFFHQMIPDCNPYPPN